jgi:flavin-dependent dehydrogenase
MKKDVVIVGGGPGGAAAAMFLLEQGIKPLIIEKVQFPRYHIGESLTGGGALVLRQLGLEQEMYSRKHPVKLGVKVYGQSKKGTWFVPVIGRGDDGKLFLCDTWQVRRSDFDQMMLNIAIDRGAEFMLGQAIRPIQSGDGTVRGLTVRMPDGGVQEIQSEVLLDCSGQATWLGNLGGITGPKFLGAYDKQIAIFSQVEGAIRDNGPERDQNKDNTLIFYKEKYHWGWFIPLDENTVSVGIVSPAAYFLDKKESRSEYLAREIRELHPDLARRIPDPKFVEDVHVIPNYSYQVKGFCGKGFACVGDAHRFIDPIFSFGLTVALQEAQFLAPAIKDYLSGKNRDVKNPFQDHQLFCEKGIDVLEDLIDCFWEHPFPFAFFVHLRYTEHVFDFFAGRMYGEGPQTTPALLAFRNLLRRQEIRDLSYKNGDSYSVPIGSRFHPENAPLWQPNSPVPTTEEWLGPR